MIINSYKGRQAQRGQVVEVYRNLNNGMISVRDAETKLVLGHAKSVHLKDVTFKVSQKGRERVLRELKKNVHAYVKGTLCENLVSEWVQYEVAYNPYKYSSFVDSATGHPIYSADAVIVDNFGKVYVL